MMSLIQLPEFNILNEEKKERKLMSTINMKPDGAVLIKGFEYQVNIFFRKLLHANNNDMIQ